MARPGIIGTAPPGCWLEPDRLTEAECWQLAEEECLTLVTSDRSNSSTGYKGVVARSDRKGKPFEARAWSKKQGQSTRQVTIGYFGSAVEGALAVARHYAKFPTIVQGRAWSVPEAVIRRSTSESVAPCAQQSTQQSACHRAALESETGAASHSHSSRVHGLSDCRGEGIGLGPNLRATACAYCSRECGNAEALRNHVRACTAAMMAADAGGAETMNDDAPGDSTEEAEEADPVAPARASKRRRVGPATRLEDEGDYTSQPARNWRSMPVADYGTATSELRRINGHGSRGGQTARGARLNKMASPRDAAATHRHRRSGMLYFPLPCSVSGVCVDRIDGLEFRSEDAALVQLRALWSTCEPNDGGERAELTSPVSNEV